MVTTSLAANSGGDLLGNRLWDLLIRVELHGVRRATYTMQFDSYQRVPESIAEEIIARVRGE